MIKETAWQKKFHKDRRKKKSDRMRGQKGKGKTKKKMKKNGRLTKKKR